MKKSLGTTIKGHNNAFLFILLVLAMSLLAMSVDVEVCNATAAGVSVSKKCKDLLAAREEKVTDQQPDPDEEEEEEDEDEYEEFEDEDFYAVETKTWAELLPETRRHYETRGYTEEMWDNEETPYAELEWEKLTTVQQEALVQLGWSSQLWRQKKDNFVTRPVSEQTPWKELSPQQKEAAITLGHSEERWHVPPLRDFHPVVTHLPIPELQAFNLEFFAQLDNIKVLVRDGSTVGDDEHCASKAMTMKEYIQELRNTSAKTKYYLKYEDEESYKTYIQSIIGPHILKHMGQALRNSELRQNGSFPPIYDNLPLTDYNWAFWLGGTNSTTSMHYDTDTMNFLWVAEGRKRVVMIPNDERTAGKYTCQSQYWEHSCWTGVDILSGDLPDHAVEVELGPGDGILFPHMCWHAVQNLEPTVAFGYRIDLAEFANIITSQI
jgi:hypothetical protein